jgi:hypothetical protein
MNEHIAPPRADDPPKIISRTEAKALGLRRYYTGFPCTAGHRSEKFVSDGRGRRMCRTKHFHTPELERDSS